VLGPLDLAALGIDAETGSVETGEEHLPALDDRRGHHIAGDVRRPQVLSGL
jgi:hypothetical protein